MATFQTFQTVLFVISLVLSGTIDYSSMVSGCAPCNTGWIEFRHRCHLIVNEQKTFGNAEAHCQTLSRPGRPAHLMSINGKKENDFLREYAKIVNVLGNNLWIGLRRYDDFEWLDGSQESYRNWGPDQPDNGPDGSCVGVFIPGGGWWDRRCSRNHPFVCEMPYRFSTN